jgi:hypothetical protein
MRIGEKVRGLGMLAVACGGAFWAASAGATPITVQNNSFETPYVNSMSNPLASEQVAINAPPWVNGPVNPSYEIPTGSGIFANSGTEGYPSGGALAGMDGTQAAYVFPEGNYFVQALVDPNSSQNINFQGGLSYQVSALVALAQSAPVADDQLVVGLYYLPAGTMNPNLTPISVGGNLVPVTQEILYNNGQDSAYGLALNGTSFEQETVTGGPAPAAADQQQIYAAFSTVAAADDSGGEYDVDNIQVAVPEPASLLVFALGGAGLLIHRRRR